VIDSRLLVPRYDPDVRSIGRYELWTRIASGGMGSVHLGCARGEAGFRRAVAIKSMNEAIASDAGCVRAFIDEAHLTARLRHPNIVATLDVVGEGGELILVMEYVHGESLTRLAPLARGPNPVPAAVAVSVMIGALQGLHAAHEATGDDGQLLDLVHRDVSPQNIIVGADGVARIADFGIAKATGRIQTTTDGSVKGKIAYMAPEQISADPVDRRTDIFAIGIVLWESLCGVRLFSGKSEAQTVANILDLVIDPPSARMEMPHAELDAIVVRALDRDPAKSFQNAREMAKALEKTGLGATTSEVGEWVQEKAKEALAERARVVTDIERGTEPRSTKDLGLLAQQIATGRDELVTLHSVPGSDPATSPSVGLGMEMSSRTFRAKKASRALVIALAAASLGLTAAITALVVRRPDVPPPTAPAAMPAPTPTPTHAPTPTEPPPVAPPSLVVPSAPVASIAPSHSPPAPRTKTTTKPPATNNAPKPNCADPYTRDELGRKIYKRECLVE
jgi:serine/threonine-protein kinase